MQFAASLTGILLLGCVHVFYDRLRLALTRHLPHWTSIAGGIAVGYVFPVHVSEAVGFYGHDRCGRAGGLGTDSIPALFLCTAGISLLTGIRVLRRSGFRNCRDIRVESCSRFLFLKSSDRVCRRQHTEGGHPSHRSGCNSHGRAPPGNESSDRKQGGRTIPQQAQVVAGAMSADRVATRPVRGAANLDNYRIYRVRCGGHHH